MFKEVGYIINGESFFLKTINSLEERIDKRLPILIVGLEKAMELCDDVKLTSKVISKEEKIYYCENEQENSNYYESIDNFLKNTFKDLFSPIIHYSLDFNHISFNVNFLYEDSLNFYLVDSQSSITLISKEYLLYVNGYIPSIEEIENTIGQCDKIDSHFKAKLKTVDLPLIENIERRLKKYSSPIQRALYFARIDSLIPYSSQIKVWGNAIHAEEIFKKSSIRIDLKKAEEYYPDKLFKEFMNLSSTGLENTTGRIFSQFSNSISPQTLPKHLRDLIIAQDNNLLYEFDYNYFEIDLLYQICLNKKIEEDPHEKLAIDLFNTIEKRDICKSINFAVLYGKNLTKVYEEFKIPQEIQGKIEKWYNQFIPMIKTLTEEYEEKGFITNYFGRTIYPKKQHALLNNFIQSSAADFLIQKIIKIDKLLLNPLYKNCYLLFQNHDAIIMDLSLSKTKYTPLLREISQILNSKEKGISASFKINKGVSLKLENN